jgi:hypothetical protein
MKGITYALPISFLLITVAILMPEATKVFFGLVAVAVLIAWAVKK